MDVFELDDDRRSAWDAYVYGAASATVWHLSGWKPVFEDILGLQSHYLYASEDGRHGEICGVLPLWEVRNLLSGHLFTSMPGGLCADTESAASALVARAKELVKSRRARYLVLRDGYRRWDLPGLETRAEHCTLVVTLTGDPEDVWRAVDRRVRQKTNKALRAGLEVVTGPEHAPAFYATYARALRDMGTPSQGAAFFQEVAAQLPNHFDVMAVRNSPHVIGGGYLAPFRDTVYCTWGGTLRDTYDLNPNCLLYWRLLKWSSESGYRKVDLGRSLAGSGTYHFKRQWTAEPQALYQQFYLNRATTPPPIGSQRERHAGYRFFVQVWRRMPLPLVEIVGPRLRRAIPFG